jgi:peptidoglycan/LPS O-acetylase OafA/YrhL
MAPAQSKSPVRYQLDFIDGLRALAALYIVTHHAVQTAGFVRWWTVPFTFGREVVVVFIAISGFCLGLPLARRGQWTLDARTFYRKRIRRILPPYYAALAVGFLIIAIYAMLGRPQDYLGHRFKWAMIWSHIALVQNWMPSQFVTVDGPLWSISIECQIYLLFPLVAWLWHRTGRWITLGVLFLFVHLVTHFAHGGGTNFLFAFGVGLLGVDLAFRPQSRPFLLAGVAVSLVAIPLTRPSQPFRVVDRSRHGFADGVLRPGAKELWEPSAGLEAAGMDRDVLLQRVPGSFVRGDSLRSLDREPRIVLGSNNAGRKGLGSSVRDLTPCRRPELLLPPRL